MGWSVQRYAGNYPWRVGWELVCIHIQSLPKSLIPLVEREV